MSDNLIQLASKQLVVNDQLVGILENQLKLAKEGRITLFAMMNYCAAEEERWFSHIEKGNMCTVTDCYTFTETLSRQVSTMRNFADDLRDEEVEKQQD